MLPTLHPAHARLRTGISCPFPEPFSARGSLAETEASQRLVEAIYLVMLPIAQVPFARKWIQAQSHVLVRTEG